MQQNSVFSLKKLKKKVGKELRHSIDYPRIHKQPEKMHKNHNNLTKQQPRKSIYSLAVQSNILINDIEIKEPNSTTYRARERRSDSSAIPKTTRYGEHQKLRLNKEIKLQRYSKQEMSKQKTQCDEQIDLKYKTTKEQVGLLRRIIDHYKIKSLQRTYYANLVNNLGIKINNGGIQHNNSKFVTVKGSNNKQNKGRLLQSTIYQPSFRIKHLQQLQSLDLDQMFKSPIKIEAQSINRFLRKNSFKEAIDQAELLNTSTMKGLKEKIYFTSKYRKQNLQTIIKNSNKKLHQKSPDFKITDSKASLIEMSQNVVSQKINKFKQFLFIINFTHNIYRELDIVKYDVPFKYFVGRGNNSNLIRSLMKKRFWFEETKNKKQAHYIWTQLKEQFVFEKQNKIVYNQISAENSETIRTYTSLCQPQSQRKKQLKNSSSIQSQTFFESNHSLKPQSRSPVLNPQKKVQKQTSLKVNFKSLQIFQPRDRICSKAQTQAYNTIMQHFTYKKKPLFNERLRYMKKIKKVDQDFLGDVTVHNHLPLNGLLGNKKAMFYMLRQFYKYIDKNIFQFVPLTFHIKKGTSDPQFTQLMNQFAQNQKNNVPNYWIIKPGQFSNRGQGISCTTKAEDIKNRVQNLKRLGKNKSLIVQKYMANPLLFNGRKFDIRTYMLISTNNGVLRAYWYQEGYVRTSSYFWRLDQITDPLVHLTNDAIQKNSDNYGKYQAGNKLTYSQLQRYLDGLPRANSSKSKLNFMGEIYPKMKQIATDAVKATFNFIDKDRKGNNFQIFGFDFMIDSHFKPWLIEINTNPCLEMNCLILQRIIPSMVENAFRIGLDPIFPPPLNYSSTYKYSIPQNALYYNKFQLIFDEDRDGSLLRQLYRDSNIMEMVQDYEEDKEVYEEQGQEIQVE